MRCGSSLQELQTAVASSCSAQPDLQFEHPAGVQVCVFGVEHLENQPHIGEWILANRPAAVVVETACTPEHGSQPGRAVTCRDQVPGAAGMFLRVFCQIAAALQEQGAAALAPGAIWSQASGQFNGEQLAYIAALASGSQLLFGDRPKDITYKRLFDCPSLAELDAAFAAEVAAVHSANLLQLTQPDEQQAAVWQQQWQQHQQQLSQTCVWNIMMREREAVMLGVIDQVCSKGLEVPPGASQPTVALVVGSAHLPGLEELWNNASWQGVVGPDGLSSSSSPVMQAPRVDHEAMQQPGAGAKRGLLEAVLQLSVPPEVLQDVQDVLPPVPDEQAEAQQITYEIYSTFRMQLAALPEPLLQEVCGAVKGTSLQQLLQPLRAMRPVNGGPGWDMDVVMQLRTLNFDLSGTANTAQ
uniref:Uncharacterized protein n=1 Tax=Tetradesmus obliquus TaxID=3088 RepID=A0A383WDL8_TETOB|eukprot:jgi/Sobl393_1/7082/SZX75698.1